MPTQTTQPFTILEQTSAEMQWTFEDSAGAAIQNPALSTATLTLYDIDSNTIINSRDDQDILGLDKTGNNDVDVVNGIATWYIQPLDNAIISGGDPEAHIALIEWTWNPGDGHGVRQGRQEILILVDNLNRVP